MQRIALITALVPFSVVTTLALWKEGYWGVIALFLSGWAGAQIFLDLAIALGIILWWMVQDARRNGRKIWIWVFVTLVMGSLGPILYLLSSRREV
ncbi:MAG: DUF2834 domain-containing protein [Rhizobiales bacterium]|nr:DUF2834 domain-containing protein [Hyphomicrobiales bacterium]